MRLSSLHWCVHLLPMSMSASHIRNKRFMTIDIFFLLLFNSNNKICFQTAIYSNTTTKDFISDLRPMRLFGLRSNVYACARASLSTTGERRLCGLRTYSWYKKKTFEFPKRHGSSVSSFFSNTHKCVAVFPTKKEQKEKTKIIIYMLFGPKIHARNERQIFSLMWRRHEIQRRAYSD